MQKSLAAYQTVFKVKQYIMLLKVRLSLLVVFSGAFGYLLASGQVNSWAFPALLLGSFLITGAANIINQILEKDLDKLMGRTSNRPLPTGRLSVSEAIGFTVVLTLVGSGILVIWVSPLAAALALFSLILYAFVYTPLKQVTPLSVLVGAFPGAFPPLIGWVAATGVLSIEAFIIFGIQFVWQFPHFWAIAWVGHDDYTRAGFRMLPSVKGKGFQSAFQITIYTLMLIPMGFMPTQLGITGVYSGVIAIIAGAVFLFFTLQLMKSGTKKAALRIMFASFFYLPIVQIAFLLDKM